MVITAGISVVRMAWLPAVGGLLIGALIGAPVVAVEPASEQAQFFESRVRPILAKHCFKCHAKGAQSKGGLQLWVIVGGTYLQTI